jgi:hypothetical protein
MTEPGPAEPVVRPLPQPSIGSEAFWASGADGLGDPYLHHERLAAALETATA